MKHLFAISVLLLSGCASLEIDGPGPGFVYYDPAPFLSVSCDKDGNQVAAIVTIPDPGRRHTVRPGSGWGSSTQSVSFQNGMVTTFNQVNDPKSLETLNALVGMAGIKSTGGPPCRPHLYPLISNGGTVGIGPELQAPG